MQKGIQKIFEEVPGTYELVNHVLTLGMDVLWRRRAAKIAAVGGGGMWMDVCSGTGEMALLLKGMAPSGTRVFSVDFCFPMLMEAAKKISAKEISFSLADAGRLPFADDTFDLITVSFATRNLNVSRAALIRVFGEFRRVLKNGGRFVNIETSQPDSGLIRKLLHIYVKIFVQPIGRLISGSKAGYTYLSNTIPRFYSAGELSEIILSAGFSFVECKKMMFGAAAIHRAVK